jgi:hypothetical protein
MAETQPTQAEADDLIMMAKYRLNEQVWNYPGLGGRCSIPLISSDRREAFVLNLGRSRIDLRKGSYHMRARQIVMLVRLCFGAAPHTNPDGTRLPGTHLHLYREGYEDKWAVLVPTDDFPNVTDLRQTLNDFILYCHIVEPPTIQHELFT